LIERRFECASDGFFNETLFQSDPQVSADDFHDVLRFDRDGTLEKLAQEMRLGGWPASGGDLGKDLLHFEERETSFGPFGERLGGYRAGIAVLTIDFCELNFRPFRKLRDYAPQQRSSDLQGGFVVGCKWAPGEEDGGNRGVIWGQGAEVAGGQGRLLYPPAGRGDGLASLGEAEHEILML
jgi:hypothetical protein